MSKKIKIKPEPTTIEEQVKMLWDIRRVQTDVNLDCLKRIRRLETLLRVVPALAARTIKKELKKDVNAED